MAVRLRFKSPALRAVAEADPRPVWRRPRVRMLLTIEPEPMPEPEPDPPDFPCVLCGGTCPGWERRIHPNGRPICLHCRSQVHTRLYLHGMDYRDDGVIADAKAVIRFLDGRA